MLDQIGVPLVHAVIGSSVGGMQALQFAAEFPEKLSRLAVFCATGQTSPVSPKPSPRLYFAWLVWLLASIGAVVRLKPCEIPCPRHDPLAIVVIVVVAAVVVQYTVGLRRVQRQAILADEHFHGGDYADYGTLPAAGPLRCCAGYAGCFPHRCPWCWGDPCLAGLRVAREIGMLTYKCRDEYDARFDWRASRQALL